MKRREFLTTGTVAAALAGTAHATLVADHHGGGDRPFIELRTFHLSTQEQHDLVTTTLDKAGVAAMNRAGCMPVGVFVAKDSAESKDVHVLTPFKSLQHWASLSDVLSRDATFTDASWQYLNVPKASPAYDRVTLSLFQAFEGFPKVATPAKGKDRFFELRVYESHSELKGKLKVEMFNMGEIEIFDRVGLNAVFYGEALAGPNLPNLTYMLGFESEEAHTKAWDGFRTDPGWIELRQNERYKDTVSKIVKTFLVPGPGSQI